MTGGPLGAANDDGRPDERLVVALAAHDGSPASRAAVLAALVDARVFLALSARALGHERSATTGLVQESEAEMSLLSLGSATGGRALPAFPDGHEVQRWRPEARPVRVMGPQACSTALEDGADVLLLDPAGARVAITRDELAELAAGRVPVPGTALSARHGAAPDQPLDDPALVAALARALAGERGLRQARLLLGQDGPVLGLVPRSPLPPADLAALASRVADALGSDLPAVGLDVVVVAADGPGTAVPVRGRGVLRRRG